MAVYPAHGRPSASLVAAGPTPPLTPYAADTILRCCLVPAAAAPTLTWWPSGCPHATWPLKKCWQPWCVKREYCTAAVRAPNTEGHKDARKRTAAPAPSLKADEDRAKVPRTTA